MRLSLKTTARALDLPASTLERWIRQGRIPVQRSGSEAVFSRSALEKWAATHKLSFCLDKEAADPTIVENFDSLSLAMQRGMVCRKIAGADAMEILRAAVQCIDFLAHEVREELFEKLMEREQLASTGIGNGIAIPHPRDPLSNPPKSPVITTCFAEKPVPFAAIDDRPVSVFFLLLSPTVKHHLHLLSRLSYCIRDRSFVDFVHTRPEADELYWRVAEIEKQLDALG
jgi:PTS system nitrogen regulatory IIA component